MFDWYCSWCGKQLEKLFQFKEDDGLYHFYHRNCTWEFKKVLRRCYANKILFKERARL